MITRRARLRTLVALARSAYRSFSISGRWPWQLRPDLVWRVLGASLLTACAFSPAWGAIGEVTSLADNGLPGTLRTQIAAAAPGDTIVFKVTGTITLKLGPLEIQKNLIINGPGEAKIFIDGAGVSTVFQVYSGVAAVISGVTIENGFAGASGGGGINNQGSLAMVGTTVTDNTEGVLEGPGGDGEGIYNSGILKLLNSTVSDNHSPSAGSGGGIYNSGTLEVISSTVSDNSPGFFGPSGGGIYNSTGGKVSVVSSIVSDNTANVGDEGGGIYNEGWLRVANSTVSDNVTFAGSGGGINNSGTLETLNSTFTDNSAPLGAFGGAIGNTGIATVTKSTLSGNSSSEGFGGAIYNEGTLTIVNSTLSGNSSDNDGRGGAIYSFSGTVTITFSTFSQNSAEEGGAIDNEGTLILKSTLLAGQSSGGNCLGTEGASSDGYNLSDDSSCTFLTETGDQNDSSTAGLSPSGLQNNGGPTQPIALLSTSSAVNAIPVSACTDTMGNKIYTDQRGVKRPQGSGCDIGAFELAMKK